MKHMFIKTGHYFSTGYYLSPANDKAWRWLDKLEHGGGVEIRTEDKIRSPRQHRLYWALIQLVFNNLPEHMGIASKEVLSKFVLIRTGQFDLVIDKDQTVFIPRSIAFANMSHENFTTFFESAKGFLAGWVGGWVNGEALINEIREMTGG